MIQGLTNLARVPEREVGGVARGREVARTGAASLSGLSVDTEHVNKNASLFSSQNGDEFSAVINFELVPSGKIYVNREVREHIIDFFQ